MTKDGKERQCVGGVCEVKTDVCGVKAVWTTGTVRHSLDSFYCVCTISL